MSQYPSPSCTAAGRQTSGTSAKPRATANQRQPPTRITSDAIEDEELDRHEEAWPGRLPSSARRYPIPARASAPITTAGVPTPSRSGRHLPAVMGPSATTAPSRRVRRVRFHWLVFVGLAMFIMIVGWLAF